MLATAGSKMSIHDEETLHKAAGRLADVLALIQVLALTLTRIVASPGEASLLEGSRVN